MTGRIFLVDLEDLKKASVITEMANDLGIGKDPAVEVDDEVLPLLNLTEKCMEKLIEWCRYHKDDEDPPTTSDDDFNFKDELSEWDLDFLKMDDATLFDLILAANYLEIKGLLDVTTTYVARIITELRTPEEIRKRFNIKNDLTPEDLEQIKKEAEHWLEDEEEAKPTTSTMGAGDATPSDVLASPPAARTHTGEGAKPTDEGAVGGRSE